MAGAAGEGGGGSRLPNNWQGLFRFCTDATRNEDNTRESTFVEMDPENVLEAQGSAPAASGVAKDAASKNQKTSGAAASSGGGPKGHGQGHSSDLDPETARINQDKALEALGLYRYRIPGDGNCLYRAVAWQLKFDQDKYHPLLRRVSVKWMREYAQELMASGLLDTVEEIEETDKLGTWPGQAAIVSLANIFGINIAIVQGGDKGDIDIQHIAPFEQETNSDQGSVILAYLYNGHYDAVVDSPSVENPDFERWMLNVQKAHSEGTLHAQSPVAQDPYYSYVLHNGYDTLKLRQQQGETLPAYVATSAPASSAAPPHSNDYAPLSDTLPFEEEPPRFETDHSLETIRSRVVDRATVDLQEIFTPDEEDFDTSNAADQQDISLQDTIHNLDNERESGITNKLAYREGDVLIEGGSSVHASLGDSPVSMTTDDVMTDLEARDRLPSDMFVSSSASSLATESEMSIHLDDDLDTASQNFDSDCESRFTQPQESSILFDDVFDHGSDQPDTIEEPITTNSRYTKSLDRRWLRNRSREGVISPPGSAEEDPKAARPVFRPRPKIQRTGGAKEATPYQRPQVPDKKSDGWGINTSELLQAAGVTHVKPGETMAKVSQKYGPIKLDEPQHQPGVMYSEDASNKEPNTGTLRSDRFLAKRKKEGRKFPLLKTDGDPGQGDAKQQSVLSPPADIPSSANVLSNLEALREWREKYGPQANNTVVHDGESNEPIREGSYDSPDIFMKRSESREESVESVIHVPSQQQKDTSQENRSVNSLQNDSTMRPSMQDMAHTEEMTVAGGYANNTQPLSSGNMRQGDNIKHNERSVSSPSRTFVGDSNTMTRSLPYKSSTVNAEPDRTSSPSSNDGGDGPRGFSRRRAGYQHPRIARSRSNDAILDSPDRNGFDPNDSVRGSDTTDTMTADYSYDTLKGSARAQALLKSRMRPGRSPGRSLGKDPDGQQNYASLPPGATRDKRYEPDCMETNTEPINDKQDFSSLPPQPFFNPDPTGPSVPSESQPSQSHPNFSSSRPSKSSTYTSSSSHNSEGPGLTNEELVNARRFSLESSQRVEDILVKDPTEVLPPELMKHLTRPTAARENKHDKASFEATRRFRQAEQDYMHTHVGESETARESESRHVGGSSKLAGHSNFARSSNASQQIEHSSSMHEQEHVGYNQHESMNEVDSSFHRELTAEEKSVAAAYSTQSASADVMSGMSALSGISLNKSDEPPHKAPPRFVRQMSSPSMGRKVIHEMQQESTIQPKPFTQQHEPAVQPKSQPKPFVQPPTVYKEPIVQPKPSISKEPKPFVLQQVQPEPFVEEPMVSPKYIEVKEPIMQPNHLVNHVSQPKPFMLHDEPIQSNTYVQEETFIEEEPPVQRYVERGPVLEQKAEVYQPEVPPKDTSPPKIVQQEIIVQPGPVLQRPSVEPKPTVQRKPFQPFRIADIPKKVVQRKEVVQEQDIDREVVTNNGNMSPQMVVTNNGNRSPVVTNGNRSPQTQRIVEREIVSPPVLHSEDSSYGFPVKQTVQVAEENRSNELMKSKLWQQQQQKMHEMQQEEEEDVNASVEQASIRRQEITSQVSTSDEVRGSAPRMRVLPLHFVGRKGQTFTRQLSTEEEQALMSRRAKREELERQPSIDSSSDQNPQRGRSSTRESSQDSFNSVPEDASPKRYRSVERILVGDASAASSVAPASPGVSATYMPGIEIRVANEQGAQGDVRRTTENVVHEVGSESLFQKISGGATHGEVETAMKQGAQGNVSEQSTPNSTLKEEITSPRIIQTQPYLYQSPPDTPSYASSVCSSTGLREVEEIHCQHPHHQHFRSVKARSQVPASLLFPGKVTVNRTSPAGSNTSSPYVTPPTSGRTSPSMSMHSQAEHVPFKRTIPVHVTNENRKGNFVRSHSHWDGRGNDFEKRVDNMFNQHVERERRGSVPISIQRVSRQPADGASLPNQGQEKAAAAAAAPGPPPPAAARSNSVPNAAQPNEGEQAQDDRPPPGIVKDRLREWVEGQRAHQGNWDTFSQQSEVPSQSLQSERSETDSQRTQSCDESGTVYSEDSRAESATPTPSTPGQSEQCYTSGFRRYNAPPNPQPSYQHGSQYGSQHGGSQYGGSQYGPQQRVHREFVEERSTTDPVTGGTQWHRSFATESSGFDDGGRPDTWSARVELPNRSDWPQTGRRERMLRLRDRPFFLDVEREFEFPSMLRPIRHRLRDDFKSAFDDDWFFRH